jgi:hypothetical protein
MKFCIISLLALVTIALPSHLINLNPGANLVEKRENNPTIGMNIIVKRKKDEDDDKVAAKGDDANATNGTGTLLSGNSISSILNIVWIAVGGALAAFGTGKLPSVTLKYAQMIGGGAALGLASDITLKVQRFIALDTTINLVITVVAAGAGAYLVQRGNTKVGNFGLGALAGFAIACFSLTAIGTSVNDPLIRYLIVGGISGGIGFLVMTRSQDKFFIYSALVGGSFLLFTGLGGFFPSNFSTFARASTAQVRFGGFDQNTIIMTVGFAAVIGAGVYFQQSALKKGGGWF